MNHKINWDCCEGVFAVPDAVVDKGLKLAAGKSLKVLIYLLRCRSLPEKPEDIGVTAEDIEDAISYWEQMGILERIEEKAPAVVSTAAPAYKEPQILPQRTAPIIRAQKSLLPTEISERIESSEEIRFLFQTAESSLKRALTFDDQRSILWFFDHLGIPADIITMLIASCCSIGYTSMGKIEKIALDWHDKNIVTHEQAENEILAMHKAFSFEGTVQSRLKLQSKLTASQKKYISEWSVMDINIDLVELAYDRTVDSIGKPSFNYMHKIITKWHENGIKDTAAAEQFDDRPKNTRRKEKQASRTISSEPPSYDLDLLFEHAMNSTPTVRRKKEAK